MVLFMPRRQRVPFFLAGRHRDPEISRIFDGLCNPAGGIATNQRRRGDLEELCQMVFADTTWHSPNVGFQAGVVSRAFRAFLLLDDTALIRKAFPLAFSNPEYVSSVYSMGRRHGFVWLNQRSVIVNRTLLLRNLIIPLIIVP